MGKKTWLNTITEETSDNGVTDKIFTLDTIKGSCEKIESGVEVPVIKCRPSALNNKQNSSITIHMSIDEKSTWANGIYQNSRYIIMMLHDSGRLELLSKAYQIKLKPRACTVKSIDDAILKLNKYIGAIMK